MRGDIEVSITYDSRSSYVADSTTYGAVASSDGVAARASGGTPPRAARRALRKLCRKINHQERMH